MRRATEASEEFINTYRWPAGVEATMSQYDFLPACLKGRTNTPKITAKAGVDDVDSTLKCLEADLR